jgi:hypothetical protein
MQHTIAYNYCVCSRTLIDIIMFESTIVRLWNETSDVAFKAGNFSIIWMSISFSRITVPQWDNSVSSHLINT